MFKKSVYIEKEGFKKLEYLCREVGLSNAEIAYILKLNEELVEEVLRLGFLQHRDSSIEHDDIFARFYYLFVSLDYLLKITVWDLRQVNNILRSDLAVKNYWGNFEERPPWFGSGFLIFLKTQKMKGLVKAFTWITKHEILG